MNVLFPAPGGPDSPILNAMLALPRAAACWRQCAISVVTRWRDWAPAPARLDSTSVMPRAAERGEVRHVACDTSCDGDPPSAALSPPQMPATSCCVLASMEGERSLLPTLTKRHRLQAGRCFTSSSCNLT